MGRNILKAAYYFYRLQDEVNNKIHSVKSLIAKFYFPQKCKINLFVVKNKLLSLNLYHQIRQLYIKMVQRVTAKRRHIARLMSVCIASYTINYAVHTCR